MKMNTVATFPLLEDSVSAAGGRVGGQMQEDGWTGGQARGARLTDGRAAGWTEWQAGGWAGARAGE